MDSGRKGNPLLTAVSLYGAGGHAKVVREIAIDNSLSIRAIFDDRVHDQPFVGHTIHPGFNHPSGQSVDLLDAPFIVTIGNNKIRSIMAKKLPLAPAIAHSSTNLADDVTLGNATVVIHCAIIQSGTTIGKSTIINTGCVIGPSCTIGDFAHVSPQAHVGENVTIGDGVHIGAQAMVGANITIGDWSVIGAGAVVTEDIPPNCTAVGRPTRIIRKQD
jgi:acetyltransferase EpsM